MPALPSNLIRQPVKPTAVFAQEDALQRTLDFLGLAPLTESSRAAHRRHKKMMASAMMPSLVACGQDRDREQIQGQSHGQGHSKVDNIQLLPLEIQKELFKHSSSADLVSLSLVSRHFRHIAAEHLYRNFSIVFPDDDDPANDSTIDGLAGGLETFVTSDYDYAQHVREISLYTLSGGDKGEQAYRQYLYALSCGKFMNTLLLLTLRKAKALENFTWDIRVELSRQVFKALHQIPSLTTLHLRMQAGLSMYEVPPPIHPPSSLNLGHDVSIPDLTLPFSHPLPPSMTPIPPPPPPTTFPGGNSFFVGKLASKSFKKANSSWSPPPSETKGPPTLSGFKNLKALAILDMDTLDYVTEISTCVRNSSSTLNSLKLSFSESLASLSRKPPPDTVPDDDSDQDVDEFGQMIPPPPGVATSSSDDASAPSKAFRAQEEKKAQEAVLERIFGINPALLKKQEKQNKLGANSDAVAEEQPVGDGEEDTEARRAFITNLNAMAAKFMATTDPNSKLTVAERQTLATLLRVAKVHFKNADKEDIATTDEKTESAESSTAKATPASSSASLNGGADDDLLMGGATEVNQDQPGLFDEPKRGKKKDSSMNTETSNPDDIDVDEPEGSTLVIDFEETSSEPQADRASDSEDTLPDRSMLHPSATTLDTEDYFNEVCRAFLEDETVPPSDRQKFEDILREKQNDMTGWGPTLTQLNEKMKELEIRVMGEKMTTESLDELKSLQEEIHSKKAELARMVANIRQTLATKAKEYQSEMTDYIRETRGLALETLAIYLIPIKATILSRAIDLTILRQITLLNVGPQTPFWLLLTRENKVKPLPLQKIHTDNVTLSFLAFVSQLDKVTELYLLERTLKTRVESFASKTTVTIEQIRRLVLRKHASTLKILMIKNEVDYSWDANDKTAALLCKRAKELEELAVSFGIRTMHVLLQYIHGLASLRALHIIQFRTDDTCMWVMREVRKFAVDSISHNPKMKLEYLALDTSVERLVRRFKKLKRKSKGKSVDKGKGMGKDMQLDVLNGFPSFGDSGIFDLGANSSSSIGGGPSSGVGGGGGVGLFGTEAESTEEESFVTDDDFAMFTGKPGLRVETIDGIRFHDVVGVRIFAKDVLGGRL